MDQREKSKGHVARRAYLLYSKVVRGFTALVVVAVVVAENLICSGEVVRFDWSVSF